MIRMLVLLITLVPVGLRGQSPAAMKNAAGQELEGFGAANNPWLGAQLSYGFGGSSEVADNFLVSARVLYDLLDGLGSGGGEGGFFLPVVGNLAPLLERVSPGQDSASQIDQRAQELMTGSAGLNVGVHPYWVPVVRQALRVTVHGGAAYKLNALRDAADDLVYLHQGRFALGAEFAVGRRTGGRLPLTLSVTPVLTVFGQNDYQQVFGTARGSLLALESTAVVPVGRGFGILLEGVLAQESRSTFRAGFVFVTEAQ